MFTKRECRRGESVAGAMWALLCFMLVFAVLFATGCGQDGQSFTANDAQVLLENGNAKGEMSLRLNGSPLSYNMTHALGPTVTIEFDGSIDFSKPERR